MTFPTQFILDWRRQTQEKWSNLIYLRTPSNWCHLAHTRCSINLWWQEPQKEWSPLVHPAPFTIELSECPSNHCTSKLCMYIVQGSLDCIRVPSDFSSANFFCLMPQHSPPFTSHWCSSVPRLPRFTCNIVGWTIPTPPTTQVISTPTFHSGITSLGNIFSSSPLHLLPFPQPE